MGNTASRLCADLSGVVRRSRSGRAAPGRSGFTIVEMLVTIGVIALLISLLLPALSGARRTARQTNELSAARQLMIGWSNYALHHRDQVIPGFKSGLRAVTADGRSVTEGAPAVTASRYLWRLAPYLDWNLRGLYVNENQALLETLENGNYSAYLYFASLSPSLGINSTWVGGDEDELGFTPLNLQRYGRFYVSRPHEVRRPDKLMVFASARGVDPLDPSGAPVPGYFRVRSPFLMDGVQRWSDGYRESLPAGEFGQVALRYGGRAVTAFIDGHTEMLGEDALRDMRVWFNQATRRDQGIVPLDSAR